MSKDREREILETIERDRNNPAVIRIVELLNLRLERTKENLISNNSEVLRGQAVELRDLVKNLARGLD